MKKKILLVCATYYEEVTESLINSAKEKLLDYNIDVIYVPGVFEIPISIVKNIKKYPAFLALGCVIKGETPHFDFISRSTTDAIMKISIDYKKPIGNGIITCLNMNQALKRKKKGAEAAKAVDVILKNKIFKK